MKNRMGLSELLERIEQDDNLSNYIQAVSLAVFGTFYSICNNHFGRILSEYEKP